MFLGHLACAFLLVLITVMFVFESEEEGTDSKKHSFRLGFRKGKYEAPSMRHKVAL